MRSKATIGSVLTFCFLAGLILAPALLAQIPTGTLTGRVQDESGAALPGVTVTATSPALQGERSSVSDGNGNYKVPALPPGTYKVTYELDGFATGVREVRVNAGRVTKSDPVSMKLAEIAEEIVVTSELESISKTNTGAASYTQEEVEKLPVQRTLTQAARLAPGVHSSGTNVANTSISGVVDGGLTWFDDRSAEMVTPSLTWTSSKIPPRKSTPKLRPMMKKSRNEPTSFRCRKTVSGGGACRKPRRNIRSSPRSRARATSFEPPKS